MAQAARPQTAEDIGRMQQEAMARMMEMQRQAQSRGGWSTDPNIPRQNRATRREEPPPPPPEPPRREAPPPQGQSRGSSQSRQQGQNRQGQRGYGQQGRQQQRRPEPPPKEKSDTTLLQDILGAVGLDDDRVLILGLILILINSKADTTLILALCYLLL